MATSRYTAAQLAAFPELLMTHQEQHDTGHEEARMSNRESATSSASGLLSIAATTPELAAMYQRLTHYNALQSAMLHHVYGADDSLVVCAPTGTGKTMLFELAVHRMRQKGASTRNAVAIYLCPLRALVAQREAEWKDLFASSGFKVAAISGDSDADDMEAAKRAHVVIATPEKLDSITRATDASGWLSRVRLLLIDEVHLLKEKGRGAVLEAVVSRFKTMCAKAAQSAPSQGEMSSTSMLRMIALSATIPNAADLGTWLGAQVHVFGNEVRSCHLSIQVRGYMQRESDFIFDRNLMYRVADVIQRDSQGKPVLVFVNTRKGTLETAAQLEKDLGETVAAYHAGLDAAERRRIENEYLRGKVRVLVSTSSLAQGVNLPAYLVVVKGTHQYERGGMEDIPVWAIMQMVGRAGRPGFETSGCAVIMTSVQEQAKWERAVAAPSEPIESVLETALLEHLNSEIVLRTVASRDQALTWLQSTFYFVQARPSDDHAKTVIDKYLTTLIDAGFVQGMLQTAIHPTEYGRYMSKYYLSFKTMTAIMALEPRLTPLDLLNSCAAMAEFQDVVLRQSDKRPLKDLLPEGSPIKKKPIKSVAEKIAILVNAHMAGVKIETFHLKTELTGICSTLTRILQCVIEVALYKKYGFLTISALQLGKHVEKGTNPVAQLSGIGTAHAQALADAGITTMETLLAAENRRIEGLLRKGSGFGASLKTQVLAIPRFKIHAVARANDVEEADAVDLTVTLFRNEDYNAASALSTSASRKTNGLGSSDNKYFLIITGKKSGRLVHCQRFCGRTGDGDVRSYHVRLSEPVDAGCDELVIDVVSEHWVGVDTTSTVTVAYPVAMRRKTSLLQNPTTEDTAAKRAATVTQGKKGKAPKEKKSKSAPENLTERSVDKTSVTQYAVAETLPPNPYAKKDSSSSSKHQTSTSSVMPLTQIHLNTAASTDFDPYAMDLDALEAELHVDNAHAPHSLTRAQQRSASAPTSAPAMSTMASDRERKRAPEETVNKNVPTKRARNQVQTQLAFLRDDPLMTDPEHCLPGIITKDSVPLVMPDAPHPMHTAQQVLQNKKEPQPSTMTTQNNVQHTDSMVRPSEIYTGGNAMRFLNNRQGSHQLNAFGGQVPSLNSSTVPERSNQGELSDHYALRSHVADPSVSLGPNPLAAFVAANPQYLSGRPHSSVKPFPVAESASIQSAKETSAPQRKTTKQANSVESTIHNMIRRVEHQPRYDIARPYNRQNSGAGRQGVLSYLESFRRPPV